LEKRKYNPSIEDLITEYKHINELIFKNQLFNPGKIVMIKQSQLKKCWGDCGSHDGKKYVNTFNVVTDKIIIRMLKSYPDYLFCRAILAHEMIHVYQFIKYGSSDHNELFYNEWKDFFKEYQIPLSENY